MSKWIETQQIISKERKDWQQGKEILQARLDLVKQEVSSLKEKIFEAETAAAEAAEKRKALLADNELLKVTGARLATSVTVMEVEIRRLFKKLPEPVKEKVRPLFERMPEDASTTKVAVAERFQNVLGILNELNKANTEITVAHEVHVLAGGRSSEVKVIYIGLAQAYYVSGRGESGIGRPTDDGWVWEPSASAGPEIQKALEILQGTHSPAFVPLPVRIQ
jgi:hypothetical protein